MRSNEEKTSDPSLEIITYGNPILRKRAAEIKNITQDIKEIAKKMIHTMHTAPGIGLAAPQINHSIRLITVDLSAGENKEDLIILVNPRIITQDGNHEEAEEGCLSVPGINEKVARSSHLQCVGYDLNENEKKIHAEGLLARVISHELDHLNGKLFIDYLSPLKKSIIKKKLKKK
ncbi:MAG: peptide deformylase [Candidatus Aminicenantes bacterium]|nr:peptide deformylase [Candidatus Aminicenantes bacterium]